MLFESIQNKKDEELPELRTNACFTVVGYSIDSLLENIKNASFSERKIQSLLKININDLLDFDRFECIGTVEQMRELWQNQVFLKCFLDLATNDQAFNNTINRGYKNEINKLIFDYVFSAELKEKDPKIKDLYIAIAKAVNAREIIPFTTIMPMDLAWAICVYRYSDLNESVCAANLNQAIVYSGVELSIKDIIYVYSRFYLENFGQLFCTTMTVVTPVIDNNPLHMKMNDRITWAILYILDSMTSADIRKVLERYHGYLSIYKISDVRFNITGLSEDFARINRVVERLRDEGLFLP